MEWDLNPGLLSLALHLFLPHLRQQERWWGLVQEGGEDSVCSLCCPPPTSTHLYGSHENRPHRPPAACGGPQLLPVTPTLMSVLRPCLPPAV